MTKLSKAPSTLKPTRRSAFKVRTGCITCKKRHIKCDETKPHCNNCLRNRGYCEGFVVDLEKKRHAQSNYAGTLSALIRGFGSGILDLGSISAASNCELWDVTLPQLARTNGTLRCIAIGIDALSTYRRQSACNTLQTGLMLPRPVAEGDAHYRSAVKYYCHSLKLLSEKTSVQDAVFISVLLLFFEVLRGNRKAALNHLNHGLALMLTLLTDKTAHHHLYALAPDPKPPLLLVAGILTHLAPQARFILHSTAGQDRPLPNFTRSLKNNDLSMESFVVLVGQLPRRSTTSDRVPSVFKNLEEFEEHWTDIRRRNSAVVSMGAKIVESSGVLGSKEEDVINNFYHDLLENPEIKTFCETSRKAMQDLDAAFLPLFNRIIVTDAQSPTYLKAVHLRLQFLQVYAFENPPQYFSAEALHSQTFLFREYLSLARVALRIAKENVSNPACQISLECGIAWHLLLLAFFCRDPITRDEAVQILREYPCQDGLWNIESLYTLALKSQTVERINAVEGTSTEQWRRLWRREYVFEDGGNRVVFRYQDKHEATGKWQMVEEVAEVGGNSGAVDWVRRPLTGFGALMMGDLVPL
ncbi:hypothetical protein N7540_006793 [Penicillium herquei]|nr:hypothetical protein N7540_006793 [Penicillium herquei]